MALTLTKASGAALTSADLTFELERGVATAHVAVAIKNPGAFVVQGAILAMYAENVPGSGDYFSDGHPATDERMGRFQATSVDSSGTPGQQIVLGQIQSLGHLATAALPDILPGNTIFADLWLLQTSSSASGGPFNIKFEVAGESTAYPLPFGISEIGRGIDSGLNQSKSFMISWLTIVATGTPDDEVHRNAGSWLLQGVEYADASTEDLTLDQDDVASATLVSGEAYVAIISQSSNVVPTVTKGVKDVAGSVVDPEMPSGDLFLARVVVNYGATGSVITTGDITMSPIIGRFYAVDGGGLDLDVYGGEAIIDNFRQVRNTKATLGLTPSTTNYVWLESNGNLTVTLTTDQPSAGALALYTVVTGGSSITGKTDTRVYLGVSGALSPHASTHASAGSDPVSPASIGAATTTALALKADLASPALSGTPTAPTAATGTDTTQLATTEFIQQEIAARLTQYVTVFPGDGVNDPSALSPVPNAVTIPFVYIGGSIQIEGGGARYNRTGSDLEQINFTPVLALGETAIIRWEG